MRRSAARQWAAGLLLGFLAAACNPGSDGGARALAELERLAFVPAGQAPFLARHGRATVCTSAADLLVDRFEVPRAEWRREGDDLYSGNRKLTVSIVTASPVSVLLHMGVNWDSTGAPVSAIGLRDLGVEREQVGELAQEALGVFAREWASIERACTKVRPVL